MKKYQIQALSDLTAPPINTWTKGEVYEVTETDTKFQLTSNEAQVAYVIGVKSEIMSNFKVV